MAKVIKSMSVNIVSEEGATVARCLVNYEVAQVGDEDLKKSANLEIPLAGQDLTNIQAVFDAALALAESAEGIV